VSNTPPVKFFEPGDLTPYDDVLEQEAQSFLLLLSVSLVSALGPAKGLYLMDTLPQRNVDWDALEVYFETFTLGPPN